MRPTLFTLSMLTLSVLVLSGEKPKTKTIEGTHVFIAAMEGGLDGFIASEIIKGKLPITVVTDEKDAEYVLVGASLKADDKWYHVVFGGKDKNEGNVRLLNVKS